MIPNDPVMLLSYVNTQLRDYYSSLDALCEDKGIGKEELVEKIYAGEIQDSKTVAAILAYKDKYHK